MCRVLSFARGGSLVSGAPARVFADHPTCAAKARIKVLAFSLDQMHTVQYLPLFLLCSFSRCTDSRPCCIRARRCVHCLSHVCIRPCHHLYVRFIRGSIPRLVPSMYWLQCSSVLSSLLTLNCCVTLSFKKKARNAATMKHTTLMPGI